MRTVNMPHSDLQHVISKAKPSPSQRFFPLHISERRVLLMLLDLLAVNSALLLALAVRPEHTLDWQLITRRPSWFLVLSVLWLLLAHAFDAYDLRVAGRVSAAAPAVLRAGSLTALIYLLIPYLAPPLPTRRALLGAFFLFILGFLVFARTIPWHSPSSADAP